MQTRAAFVAIERLEVDEVEQRGLEQLALQDRAADADQRLVGEDDGPLGHGVDVDGQLHPSEVRRGTRGSKRRLPSLPVEPVEVGDVLAIEPEAPDQLDGRREPAGDGEAALEGVAPEEQVEDGLLVDAAGLPVAVGHRELVEVGEQGERRPVEPFEHSCLLGRGRFCRRLAHSVGVGPQPSNGRPRRAGRRVARALLRNGGSSG